MTRGTELVNAVIAALEQIRPENGYRTAAGLQVTRGRAEHLTVNESSLPAIAVSTSSSTSTNVKPRSVRKEREITIVGLVDALHDDYEPYLDQLDEDINRALLPLTGIDALPGTLQVQFSGGEYIHPEGGSNVAGISFNFSVSYALTIKNQNEG